MFEQTLIPVRRGADDVTSLNQDAADVEHISRDRKSFVFKDAAQQISESVTASLYFR